MLYEILKTAKLGAVTAPDMFTGLLASKMPFAKGGIAELSGVPPLRFKSNGEPLLNWRITGNTVQNPTPQDSVGLNGVGVRTKNLFRWRLENGQYGSDGRFILNDKRACVKKEFKALIGKGDYIVSMPTGAWQCTILLFNQDGTVADNQYALAWHSLPFAFSISDDELIFTVTFRYTPEKTLIPSELTPMLNEGPTALPYEPYGYKIPVTCGGVTTDIYIGDSPLYDGDTISMADTGIVIPTVRGNNMLTVGTTVQPSEVYIKYKK